MGWLMATLLSAIVLPLHASAASPQASMVSSNPEILALGSRLFEQNCSPCHGKQAVGENPATPLGGWKVGVGQVAPALNGTGHDWHHPPSYHVRIIRDGSTLEGSRMIGWGNRMTDFDIFAVIAYFQSLWPSHIKAAYQQRYLYRVWK